MCFGEGKIDDFVVVNWTKGRKISRVGDLRCQGTGYIEIYRKHVSRIQKNHCQENEMRIFQDKI